MTLTARQADWREEGDKITGECCAYSALIYTQGGEGKAAKSSEEQDK